MANLPLPKIATPSVTRIARGRTFAGGDDGVNMGNIEFDCLAEDAWTYGAHFIFDNSSDERAIFSKTGNSFPTNWQLQLNVDKNATMQVEWFNGSVATSESLTAGTLYSVVVSWSPLTEFNIYVFDLTGRLVASVQNGNGASPFSNTSDTSSDFRIGSRDFTGDDFIGMISHAWAVAGAITSVDQARKFARDPYGSFLDWQRRGHEVHFYFPMFGTPGTERDISGRRNHATVSNTTVYGGVLPAHLKMVRTPLVQPIYFVPDGVAGAIASSLPIEFDLLADLRARGVLGATLPIELGVVADLRARGAVAAALAIELNLVADLQARGELQSALPIEFDVSADLGQLAGGLNAALAIVFDIAAELRATGRLETAADIVFSVVADLRGLDQLDATLAIVFDTAATLVAQGQLDSALDVVFDTAAELRATGRLEAALAGVFDLLADLQDGSGLEAVLPIVFNVAATLTNTTPAPALDKLGDPGTGSTRPTKAPRRFYAKRWNQFAETADAFLRRQETLVRETVREVPALEEARQVVLDSPEFQDDLTEFRNALIAESIDAGFDAAPILTAEFTDEVEAEIADMVKAIRDEEDILALVAMLVTNTDLLT